MDIEALCAAPGSGYPQPGPNATELPSSAPGRPKLVELHGVGCQIRRQAGHGAAHSVATYLEAAELIPRLAGANAQTFF